jgi:hypothetical protein
MPKDLTTWDQQLYFTSEGSRATDFYGPSPSSSAGFEPSNLGYIGKHAYTRPPMVIFWNIKSTPLLQVNKNGLGM